MSRGTRREGTRATALRNWHVARAKVLQRNFTIFSTTRECVSRRGNKLLQVLHQAPRTQQPSRLFLSSYAVTHLPPLPLLPQQQLQLRLKIRSIRRRKLGHAGIMHSPFAMTSPGTTLRIVGTYHGHVARGWSGTHVHRIESSRFYAYNGYLRCSPD